MTSASELLVAGRPLPRDLARHRAEALARHAAQAAGPADRGDAGFLAWAGSLPEQVDRLAAQWSLEIGAVLEPGGSSAWVAEVRDPSGADLLLKVGWAHDEARDEAAGLAAWQGQGAVPLARHERRGDCSALLMERVRPGRTLHEELPNPAACDVVIAALLRRLRIAPPAGSGFRPLADMCAWWADEAEERARAVLPAAVVDHGLSLFRSLPRDWDGEPVLLATDLHHHNVLSRRQRPGADLSDWALIDPKPYVGDPHYDVLQHLLNHPERLLEDPVGPVQRIAALADLDPQRTLTWLFARCVQEAGGMDGTGRIALALAPVIDGM
ncbi:aminoglycoside phosphotransferase family protein [Brachybacterium hainanense]|uniref:Aminoglycoside phosphotransferase family protein n=1 Tax=Brachybacterium hainanense TaxID=1541174 RepID=A0ABV6R6D4_9MICO